MKREKVVAAKRTVTGKAVKHLRKEGLVPGNMYGKSLESIAVQLPLKDFNDIYKKVHETGLINLEIEGETHPVLIHRVQVHPITYAPIHADFFKVNLKEKVKATIPVVAIGEPKAVTDKIGVLLQPLMEVEIEALPADLLEHIEVNVENLANIDDHITLEQVNIPSEVTLMAEPTETVFRIGELVSAEAEELAAEEEAAAEAASEEGAVETPTEGEETPAEGEAASTTEETSEEE